MRTGVYLCTCGETITQRIDYDAVMEALRSFAGVAYVKKIAFLCAEEGKQFFARDLEEERPDRVVTAACSPREYESTFMRILQQAGMNPYYLQFVNLREQNAWVTPDRAQATHKAIAQVRAAVARVAWHEPLEKQSIKANSDVVVIGAGPAGLKCTLTLAEAGRKVLLIEKAPLLGGLPVRFEELFPGMECGPCLLEPMLGDVLHGPVSQNVEVMTLAEVVALKGYYGNFTVTVRKNARYVDTEMCMGCGECFAPCPVSVPNEYNCGLNERKAIALPFLGALPNAPFIDAEACVRFSGSDCTLCRDACPVEGAVNFDESPRTIGRQTGAVVVAVGATLYDCCNLPELGAGRVPGVYTSLEFERLLASNGPSEGALQNAGGNPPQSVAIVHCVGSLDQNHRPYCSGVCCQYALKFNHLIGKKLPDARIYHLYKELVAPGKEAFAMLNHAREHSLTSFIRYGSVADIRVSEDAGKTVVEYRDAAGDSGSIDADMVILCPAVTGADTTRALSSVLETPQDTYGFFQESNGRLDPAQSKVRGIYIAGACQAPMDLQHAISQGMASAAYVLSGLAEGRMLEIEPTYACVDEERCSLCRTCGSVCPYHAIAYPPEKQSAYVNPVLCHGCGTCAAACPGAAIRANHFTNRQVMEELEAMLA